MIVDFYLLIWEVTHEIYINRLGTTAIFTQNPSLLEGQRSFQRRTFQISNSKAVRKWLYGFSLLTGLIPDAEAEASAAVGFPLTSPSDSTRDSTLTTDWRDSAQTVRDDTWEETHQNEALTPVMEATDKIILY